MKIVRYPICQAEDRVIYLIFLERQKGKKKEKKEKEATAAGSQIPCNLERTSTEDWKL